MAKMTGEARLIDHAALIVSLAEAFEKFLEASGVEIPDLHRRLQVIQEIAYQTVPTDKAHKFGLAYAATIGAAPTTPDSSPANGTLVAADQMKGG